MTEEGVQLLPKYPDTPFGSLMREGLRRTGISQGKLGGRISDFEHGPVYDASAIRMLMSGQRRLNHTIVTQIIEILDLDWAEAWAASGLLPPEVDAAGLERIRTHAQRMARRDRRADRELPPQNDEHDEHDENVALAVGGPVVVG